MSRRSRTLILGLILLSLLTLCALIGAGLWWALAGDGGPVPFGRREAPSGEESDREAARPGDVPGAAAPPGGGPTAGGELTLPGGTPSTLDPALVRDVASAGYIYEIYSGLVTLSPALEVVPDLAERWAIDPGGTTYTFTLRAGAVFHDGTPVVAQHVTHAIERACDPATASPVAETYLGDIVGCADKLAGRAPSVAGAGAPDPRTVVLVIDAPKAYFLSKLTYPTSFVVDPRQVAADEAWTRRPNATGPFRLAEYAPDERLVLARHAAYYGAAARLERVVFDLRPVSAITLYENGEIDAAPVGPADLARVRDPLNPLSSEVVEGPGDLGLSYVAFNVRVAPFDDVHVRRALNFALDKRRLADVVLRGSVEPVDGILPPGVPGHRPDAGPYAFDPARARAEIAASRYGSAAALPPLTLYTSGEGGRDPVVEAVVDDLSEHLGVVIAVEQAPWETFQAEADAGAYPMYMLGWSADYPDPQDFLDVLFHSASPLNNTGYANPEVDALLETARVEQGEAERLARYAEAERLILDDAVWLPLFTGVETWLVAPHVHGFTLPPIVLPRMAAVWVEGD